jgi:hypothetical protein
MNAPMLGRTMFDRNVPNRWTWSRIPPLLGAVSVVLAIWTFLERGRPEPVV